MPSPDSSRDQSGPLFHNDCTPLQSRADSICVMLGQMYGVVFYHHGETIGIANDEAVPSVLAWLGVELADGRWVDGGENPDYTAHYYDRIAVTRADLDSFDDSSFFEEQP